MYNKRNRSEAMTFTEFKQQQDARNTIELNIVKYSLMLCDALQADYQSRYQSRPNYTWAVDSSGRKYHKIFMYINGERDSIHCFIDKKTGEVYKPASVKSPAKGVRFNLLIMEEREFVLKNCEWSGGYLYRNAYYNG